MAFEKVVVRMPDGQQFGPASLQEFQQWVREGRVPAGAVLVDSATGEERPAAALTGQAYPPPPYGMARPATAAPTATDHLIPTKNGSALAAYYCAVFGIIPCFTVFLGPAALILGIIGMGKVEATGVGKTHALVGLILGGIQTLLVLVGVVFAIVQAVLNG